MGWASIISTALGPLNSVLRVFSEVNDWLRLRAARQAGREDQRVADLEEKIKVVEAQRASLATPATDATTEKRFNEGTF